MSTALVSLTNRLAERLELGDGAGLIDTLKATAFRTQQAATDAQMTALMIVANQFGLNPWTKEIYAFPDKNNGIVPVVGVDGWSRIINNHPQFDGIDFEQDDVSCTCIIHRKDRAHHTRVTEYMSECKRSNVGPWQSHPKRMLRHKAMIQCARIAFGYGGIYEQDEAERIVEMEGGRPVKDMGPAEVVRPAYPQDAFAKNLPAWRRLIEEGKKTAEQIIAMVGTKGTLSADQLEAINAPTRVNAQTGEWIPSDSEKAEIAAREAEEGGM